MKWIYYLIVFLFIGLSFSSCSNDDDDDLLGNWITKNEFSGIRRAFASSFVIGTKGYVFGGSKGVSKEYHSDIWEFDSELGSWTLKASFPGIAREHAAAFAIGTKGYIGVGYGLTDDGTTDGKLDYLKDFWEFDTQANAWDQKTNYPGAARIGAVGFSLKDNNDVEYGYMGFGYDYDENVKKDLYRFDGESWVEITGVLANKRQGPSVFVIDNIAYLVGGLNNSTYQYDFWSFSFNDSGVEEWNQLRNIANTSDDSYDDDYSITRQYGVAFTMNSRGYFTTGTSGSLRSDTWEYNPTTDLWEDKTSFEGGGRYGCVAFSFEGTRAFVGLGRSSTSTYYEDFREFYPFDEYEEYD